MISFAGLGFVLLSTIAAGALAFAFLQPKISAGKKVETRRSRVTRNERDKASVRAARDRMQEQTKRRKTIQSSLKELEERQKERSKHTTKLKLPKLLEQAGWSITKRQYVIMCVAFGVVGFFLALVAGLTLFLALGVAIASGVGLPRFLLTRARKRRLARFILEFPNAVDLIVRGVKSGLPVGDTLRMVASEAKDPVGPEFKKMIESLQLGIPLSEAVERLYRNVPTPETNFFAIVVGIQSQSGGNLSEALANLSKVLRERKKMKDKIQAMSMEAKASGGIIGSLPFVVAGLVSLTTPDYLKVLFTTNVGIIVLVGSGVWMVIGILAMKKMIAFDF